MATYGDRIVMSTNDDIPMGQSERREWPVGMRLFARLRPGVKPGDLVDIDGQPARVDTAKLADDLKDAKCTVVIEGPRG